jgi:hypothetical protein
MLDLNESDPWLDVHLLIMDSTPDDWVQQCIGSVELAISQAGFPVAFHQLRATGASIGIDRAIGFAQGSAPYVANVDDDDFILPNAFALMREPMLAGADGIFPKESVLLYQYVNGHVVYDRTMEGRQRHSMKTFKRDHLIDFTQWSWAGDTAQACYLEKHTTHLVDLPQATYIYRNHPGSNSRPLRVQDPTQLLTARLGDATLLHPLRRDI